MSQAARFCNQCGAGIPTPDSRFCSSCGASIASPSSMVERPPQPSRPPPSSSLDSEQIVKSILRTVGPNILIICWKGIWVLLFLAVSLRLLWSGGSEIAWLMFDEKAFQSISSFPLFNIWPGLEQQRWFGLTGFGMGVLKLGIGVLLLIGVIKEGWDIYKRGKLISIVITDELDKIE